jgi:putative flippase GtrA
MRADLERLWRWGIGILTTGFLGRVMRYGIVGVTVAVLYSLAIIGLVPMVRPFGPTVASVIGFCLVLPVGFWLHRRFSFADRAGGEGQAWRFTVTNIASFVISVGGMYVITELLRVSYLFGIAWNWVAVPAVNFGIYMLWVFRSPPPLAGGTQGGAN